MPHGDTYIPTIAKIYLQIYLVAIHIAAAHTLVWSDVSILSSPVQCVNRGSGDTFTLADSTNSPLGRNTLLIVAKSWGAEGGARGIFNGVQQYDKDDIPMNKGMSPSRIYMYTIIYTRLICPS